jgi:hypothetical protein
MFKIRVPDDIIKLIKSYIPQKCYYSNCNKIGCKLFIPTIFNGDPIFDRGYYCNKHFDEHIIYFRYS